jgi:hypothetical protein
MGKRHEAIGIKQAIRFEWMQKAANLLLAGLDAKTIRKELHEFLADRKGSGTEGERGDTSRTQVVNMLMKIWVVPDADLVAFRDASLSFFQEHPSNSLPIHWGLISATYPFWFNVARQVGRLLALQDQVTQMQITGRLKEQYGDRQTVSRYARYVIRSLVAWGVLKDSYTKGCYEKVAPVKVDDPSLAILMFESALLTTSEAKGALGLLLNNPAFFPFQLPVMSGDFVSQHSNRIEVVRYGLDDITLSLKSM